MFRRGPSRLLSVTFAEPVVQQRGGGAVRGRSRVRLCSGPRRSLPPPRRRSPSPAPGARSGLIDLSSLATPDVVRPSLHPVAFTNRYGSVSARALVDSGASANFMSAAMLLSLPSVPVTKCVLRVRLGDGRTVVTANRRVRLSFSLNAHRYVATFYVLEDLVHEVIIGLPWLVQHQPDFSWAGLPMSEEEALPAFSSLHATRKAFRKGAHIVRVHLASALASVDSAVPVPPNTSEDFKVVEEIPGIRDLLSDFADVFAPLKSLPPSRPGFDHRIRWKKGHPVPPTRPPYALSLVERAELRRQLTILLSRGWVRAVATADHAASVFFVTKPGSAKMRLVCDWRATNAATQPNVFPLPRISTLLASIHGSRLFTALDLTDAFWQVRLSDDSLPHSVVTTPFGLFQFRVMSFGLTDAPSTFQALLSHVLRGIPGVCVYLDDILIHSRDPATHLATLSLVLARLREYKLQCGLPKCVFAAREVEWLGWRVSELGVAPTHAKVESVAHWPVPSSASDVRAFCGLANFLRSHIPRYAEIAKPLYRLCGAGVVFEWDAPAAAAFAAVKRSMLSPPTLLVPDPDLPFTLQTDASSVGISAVLLQQGRVCAFASRALRGTEHALIVRNRELLAAQFGVSHFREQLHGHEFCFETDHQALLNIRLEPGASHNLVRAVAFLQSFHFKWSLKKSAEMVLADPLSRFPAPADTGYEPSPPDVPLLAPMSVSAEFSAADLREWAVAYASDSFTAPIWSHLRDAQPGTYLSGLYHLHRGLLYLSETGGEARRLVVPASRAIRARVLHHLHTSPAAGHPGMERTLDLVRRVCFWPTLYKDVRAFVSTCPICLAVKPNNRSPLALLRPVEAPAGRWEVWSMDFKTGLPMVGERDAVLVVTDRFTRRVRLIPTVSTASARDTALLLFDYVVKLHGLPTSIVSDRDPKFTGAVWTELWALFDTRLRLSTANSPQTDGASERAIRSMLTVLSAILAERGRDWLFYLPHCEIALNHAVNAATEQSPYFADLGRHPRSPLSIVLPPASRGVGAKFIRDLKAVSDRVTDAAVAARTRQVVRADKGRRVASFQVGQEVLVHHSALRDLAASSTPPVFRANYHGPFPVVEVIVPGSAYRLLLDPATRAHDVINARFLRRLPSDAWPERVDPPPPPDAAGEYVVASVEGHRPRATAKARDAPGDFRFATRWIGHSEVTWEPSSVFFDPASRVWNAVFLRYLHAHRSLPRQAVFEAFLSLPAPSQ